jgi:hypothetical protein
MLFFKDNRILLIKNYLFFLEFLIITFFFFFFTKEKIFMDQDELYYWGLKYKYFLGLGNSESAQFYSLDEYGKTYHPYITPLFHAFNSYLTRFNEGMAIFSNTLILISGFYYLFYFKNQRIIFRLSYLIIFYLILNNLSWGFLSIYNDTVVAVTYAVLIVNLINYLDSKKKLDLLSFLLILVFFLNVHRATIILAFLLIFIILIKKLKYLSLSFFLFCIFGYFFFSSVSDYITRLNIYEFYRHIIEFIKIILFSKTYNSQFGVLFNEINNFLSFNYKLFPEYILNIFIWYLIIIYIIFTTNFKHKYINYSFILIFLSFSLTIYYDKIILNNTSPQTFGRYISFALIPFIFIYLYYYRYNAKIKDITNLLFIIFLLLIITPKKSLGFFTVKNFYQNYDEVNKNYFEIRNNLKILSEEIKTGTNNKKSSAIIIYGKNHGVTEYHYSLFHSAFQLELFPIKSIFLSAEAFITQGQNLDYIFNNDIIIYYNINSNDFEKIGPYLKSYAMKKAYFFNNK